MTTVTKGLKYRLYPTAEQKQWINRCFAVRRRCWNLLHEKVSASQKQENPPKLTEAIKAAMKEVRRLKYEPGNEWMQTVCVNIAEYVSLRYSRSWQSFFRKVKSGEVKQKQAEYVARCKASGREVNPNKRDNIGKPNFQAKQDEESFQIKGSDGVIAFDTIEFKGSGGIIRFKNHRPVPVEHISTITISVNNIGEFYVSFSADVDQEVVSPPEKPSNVLALDSNIVGYVDSEGVIYEHPRPYKENQELETRLKRQLLRKQKGGKDNPPSNRYLKAKKRLNKLQKKIVRQRVDWQHKLSHYLTTRLDIDAIAIENLSIQEMMKKPLPIPGDKQAFLPNGATAQARTNKAMADVSHFRFREMLKYKSEWNGKKLIEIKPSESTNKTCSNCGFVNNHVHFRMKTWTCSECGEVHGKYVNGSTVIYQKSV